ncbi:MULTISPECIES: ABC transporter permease [Halobacterium]|uniref:ABC transporter permease n=1 Tax=Halobacterium TaxID=2239 RepID=UPI0019655BCC|nr:MULTISPECIES: ABC transporter permease [Halobacterium]MCF2166137.1 ABC transporter permease [Halobacterium salinarum]MCF2167620.1 ABC transporter permease [Halobacterium salinarum]MCF2237589.1 ABC transporter permease [Halobacterium salinarum]QRY22127.1 ABC transporter permease [Halobacterium sp. GSL-19]WJK63508.1 ABC transporter permease [Halobacterium salinarum]
MASPSARSRLLGHALSAWTVAVLAVLWLPLVVIIALSVAENAATILPFTGVTLAHYQATLQDGALLGSVANSATIATLASVLATAVGVPASVALVRYDVPLSNAFRVAVVLPMVVPGVVLGIGVLISIRTLPGITPGFVPTVLTHAVYGLPFVVLLVSARLAAVDDTLADAARDLGASPLVAFRDVTLPAIAPAVASGFLFAWVRSFEEFVRAYFVSGTTDVLTTEMYALLAYGTAPKLNVIATLVLFVLAVVLAVAMTAGDVVSAVTAGE